MGCKVFPQITLITAESIRVNLRYLREKKGLTKVYKFNIFG